MSIHVQLLIEDKQEKEKIEMWLSHSSFQAFQIQSEKPIRSNNIVIMEINSLFDWLKVRRLKKQFRDIIIFPLLDQSMLQTSPIAVELQLSIFFYKAFEKKFFLSQF